MRLLGHELRTFGLVPFSVLSNLTGFGSPDMKLSLQGCKQSGPEAPTLLYLPKLNPSFPLQATAPPVDWEQVR